MQELLSNPAVQGGVAPLVAGFAVALVLARTRFAGLAVLAGYVTVIALTTGFSFTPLSASRKILLLGLAAPVLGLIADLAPRAGRTLLPVLALAAALAAASGGLLLVQMLLNRGARVGLAGALPIAVLTALFGGAIVVLAAAPWYAPPLLLLVPLAAAVPAPAGWSTRLRALVIGPCAVAAAVPAILAAWYAARGSFG